MIHSVVTIVKEHGPAVFCISLILYLTVNRYGRGLSHFKGPVLASFTSLWGVWYMWSNVEQPPYVDLHRRYGEVVRMSPNKLSFAQPEAIRDIYGPNGLTQKSDLYTITQQVSRGTRFQTLFATTDTQWHDRVRRCVSSAFSMTSMVQYEGYVDETIKVFLHQLETRFAGKGGQTGVVDFYKWLHFFTDDAITQVTYGSRLGHLDAGEDVHGILKFAYGVSKYHMLVSQAPVLDLIYHKNPIRLWLNRHGWFNSPPPKSIQLVMKHQQERRQLQAEDKIDGDTEAQTLTDAFLKAVEAHPDVMGSSEILAMGLTIIIAGSDTTAISLSAFFYYLLKSPLCYRRLTEEVDAAFATKSAPASAYPSISFAEAQQLPYLSACIKEAFRLHPATRWFPERVVPAQGHTICGRHIPGGTIVGVNAWVLHRDAHIYGEDVEVFRPERWLANDTEKVRLMDRMLSHFGSGRNYTCIGRNIALLEMYKVIPPVIRHFELSLADPGKDWRYIKGSLVSVADFDVRVKRRVGESMNAVTAQ